MTDDDSRDLQRLWQEQSSELAPPSLEHVRRKAGAFQRKIRMRNAIEYLAALFVLVSCTQFLVESERVLQRVWLLAIVAGTLYACVQLYQRARGRALPSALTGESCLAFHRSELVRQRDALRSVWKWYLAPFVPGLVLNQVDRQMVAASAHDHTVGLLSAAVTVLLFVVIALLNRRAARKLDAELATLSVE